MISTHPTFLAHFTDEIYGEDAGEFGPFATDEGSDILARWSERPEKLAAGATVRQLLEDDVEDPSEVDEMASGRFDSEDVDGATIVVGAAFTLLRLAGSIDTEGKAAVLAALDVLQGWYGPQLEFDQMRDDLGSFHASA